MWQVLLAAAVAGTGIAAKRLLNPNADPNTLFGHTEAKKCIRSEDDREDLSAAVSPEPHLSPLPDVKLSGDEVKNTIAADESPIFRFSSSSESSRYKNRFRSKNVRKKSEGNNGGTRRCEFEESEKKCTSPAHGKNGRRLFIRLKKRRTSSKKAGPPSNDTSSSFSQGLGFGIMYMMSAGKAEISRLNMAMDETVRVVDELKTELHKRKSSYEDTHPILKSKTECMNPSCYQSEVLIQADQQEQEQEVVVEMDRLEAELESELQKLPGCMKDVSAPESSTSDDDWEKQVVASGDSNGVSASELEKKLSHLLIEQQSSQIVELEAELHKAQSKLFEKEAELRALNNCVKRLTDFDSDSDSDSDHCADEQTDKQCNSQY